MRNKDNKHRFPSKGWIFPCYKCFIPISNSILIKYRYIIVEIYICKKCKYKNHQLKPKYIKKKNY